MGKQTIKNKKNQICIENFHFLQLRKNLHIAWACFRKFMVIISHFTFVFVLNIKVEMIRLFQTYKHVAL